ncbi:hypothetical protein ACF0H5_005704 [Mactra antiquata]
MDVIKETFTGAWKHTGDVNLQEFFMAVGATEQETLYMTSSSPRLKFEVTGKVILMTNAPHPENIPEDTVELDVTLNEEFKFEPKGVLLHILTVWEDGKLTQKIRPDDPNRLLPHTIEHYINEKGELIQVYKIIDKDGNTVEGKRTYEKEKTT